MDKQQYLRLKFLEDYVKQLEMLHRLHQISAQSYEDEIKWASERVSELEREILPKNETPLETPEMKSMRTSAERFFDYVGGLFR